MNAKGVKALTAKQQKFANLYVAIQRPAVAYRMAYNAEKMSDDCVSSETSKLLKNPNIATAIATATAAADRKLLVSVEGISRELARIAEVDPAQLVDDKGEEVPFHQLPADVRRAIAGIDVITTTDKAGVKTVTRKYRFCSKVEALRILAIWKKMQTSQLEVGRPGDFDSMSDAELQARLRADNEAMDAIEKAQVSSVKKLPAKKQAQPAQAKTPDKTLPAAVPERGEK